MAEPAARVPFVGLTGGLGAGKSDGAGGAGRAGRRDAVHRRRRARAARHRARCATRWSSASAPTSAPTARVDRGAVAARVFGDAEDREWLEGLLWPRVGERVVELARERRRRGRRRPRRWWRCRCCSSRAWRRPSTTRSRWWPSEDLRAERAGARGHEAVDERAGRQLTQEEKSQRADFTVRNDGTREELKAELSRVLATIGSGSSDGPGRTDRAHTRPRRPRGARARAGGASRRWWWRARAAASGVARASMARAGPARRRGARDHPAAAPRGHHPPAGRRQGHRPGADRRGDLRGVEVPRPDLARGRARADADHARDRRVHRPRLAAAPRFTQEDLATPADQHRLRRLLPALPAAPLRRRTRRWRWPPTTPARPT